MRNKNETIIMSFFRHYYIFKNRHFYIDICMKNIFESQYLFKECKKCPVKNNKIKGDSIISPCQNCISQGKAIPPPIPQVEIKYNK